MKKTTLLIAFIFSLGILLTSCEQPSSPAEDPPSETLYAIGDTITSGGAQITFGSVTDINDMGVFAIHVQIKNTTASSIDYSSILSWGSIVDSLGTQIDGTYYLSYDRYFSGDAILPGATITDILTFDEYAGSATSFTFHAEPPFGESDVFKLIFQSTEITTEVY